LDTGYVSPGGDVLGTDWLGSELSYDTAPGRMNTNSAGLFIQTSEYTSLGTQTITPDNTSAGTGLTYSIGQLSDFLQPDNTLTIAFFGNTNTGPVATFSSISSGTTTGDTGTAPRLSFSQIPEPSTYTALLGLVALGVLFYAA